MVNHEKAFEILRRHAAGPESDFYKAVVSGLIRCGQQPADSGRDTDNAPALDALIYEACLIHPPSDSRALVAWLEDQAKTAPRFRLASAEYLALPWHALANIRCYRSGRKNPVFTVVFMAPPPQKTPDSCLCLVMGPDPYGGQAGMGKKSRSRVGGVLVPFSDLPEACQRYALEKTLTASTQAQAPDAGPRAPLSHNNARSILAYNHTGLYSPFYLAAALGLVFDGPQAENPSPAAASLAALRLDAEKIKKPTPRAGLLAWLDEQARTAPGIEIDGQQYIALPWCFLLNLECYKANKQGADEVYKAIFADRRVKGSGGLCEALEMRGGPGGWRGYKEQLVPGSRPGPRINLDELPAPCLRYVVKYGISAGMDPEDRIANWFSCRQKIRLV